MSQASSSDAASRPRAPGRWRDVELRLSQLAYDPPIARVPVLAGEAHNQLAQPRSSGGRPGPISTSTDDTARAPRMSSFFGR